MDKVYNSKENSASWQLKELTDFFYFKAKKLSTDEETNLILSWSRNSDLSNYKNEPIRKYDIEIEGEKYYFLVYPKDEAWILVPETKDVLDKIATKSDTLLIGDVI